MSIIYIHGVNVREPSFGVELLGSLKRWVGPVVDWSDPLVYHPVFWGDIASDFRWSLKSRPLTSILRMGAAPPNPSLVRSAPLTLQQARSSYEPSNPAGPVIGGPATPLASSFDLSSIDPGRRADVLTDLYIGLRDAAGSPLTPVEMARVAPAAADTTEKMWTVGQSPDHEKLMSMLATVDAHVTGVTAAGFQDWLSRADEIVRRAVSAPGDIISSFLAESRPVLNAFVANFLGDILSYLATRGSKVAPGPIPTRVLEGFRNVVRKAPGEPIVVLTHSMGGQLLFDAVTTFMDDDPELKDVRIAHWISFGSQVSFFAELGQFPGIDMTTRSPRRLKKPDRVDSWTNFYDLNDFVGFIMEPVFEGVQDREYDTGYGLALAHTGYLSRPSFFAEIAKVLKP